MQSNDCTLGETFMIRDMPGIDDGIYSYFIKNYLICNKYRTIPVLVISMLDGTANLDSLKFLRDLYINDGKFEVTIILTRFI